jgi:hypothetical protein
VSVHHQNNKHIPTMEVFTLGLLLLAHLGAAATGNLTERKLVRRQTAPSALLPGPPNETPLPRNKYFPQLTQTTPLIFPFRQDHILCRDITFYGPANLGPIQEGIKYLRAHDPPQDRWLCHQPGGGCCSRFACEMSAAIYVCNDDEDEDVLVSLSAVADLAEAITRQDCCVWKSSTGHVVVEGQAFDDGGWNVIVGIKGGDWC